MAKRRRRRLRGEWRQALFLQFVKKLLGGRAPLIERTQPHLVQSIQFEARIGFHARPHLNCMGQLIQADFLRYSQQGVPQSLAVTKQRSEADAARKLKRDIANAFELLAQHEQRIIERDCRAARRLGLDPTRPGIFQPILEKEFDLLALGKVLERNILGSIFGRDQASLNKDGSCDFAL